MISTLFWLTAIAVSKISTQAKIPPKATILTPFKTEACCNRVRKLIRINGGETASPTLYPAGAKNVTVIVSTSFGSQFLDKTKSISISPNATIKDLKEIISQKFPGTPLLPFQRLFFQFRFLNNTEVISSISSSPKYPILLDMITGTSAYNRTMSISQALDAYVSTIVHQTYLSLTMQKLLLSRQQLVHNPETLYNEDSSLDRALQSPNLREIYEAVNKTIYDQFGEDIAAALEVEKEPDIDSPDTRAWRQNYGDATQYKSPLETAWARQFGVNKQMMISLAYYSVMLLVFAKFGTSSTGNKPLLLWLVPLLWFSQFQQLRFVFKLVRNIFLQLAPVLDFVMPLLPAPYQVIAIESGNWVGEEIKSSSRRKQPRAGYAAIETEADANTTDDSGNDNFKYFKDTSIADEMYNAVDGGEIVEEFVGDSTDDENDEIYTEDFIADEELIENVKDIDTEE